MIREVAFFLRHGPSVGRKRASMGKVEFHDWLTARADEDGMAAHRAALVEGLSGAVMELGCGSGATFRYYGADVHVTAIEPDDEYRAGAERVAHDAAADIHVIAGHGESLAVADDTFDAIVCSTVLCSVDSVAETLAEFRRVLKPGGCLRLLELVRSEHWIAGPLMHLTNPFWRQINHVGCNWNRHVVQPILDAGFAIESIEHIKQYCTAVPPSFPYLLIRARM